MHYFKHNDMDNLRSIMSSVRDDDVRLKRDTSTQRRFIIAEGLYRSTGNLCPLTDIIALKNEFCYRVVLDESLSFGCIGKSGKGVTEYFNVNREDIDMLIISMGSSLASVGGVSMGTREVVDHQRLSGPGYCFSASAPPFFSATALSALTILQDQKKRDKLFSSLDRNIRTFHEQLAGISSLRVVTDTPTESMTPSPVIHIALNETNPKVAATLAASGDGNTWDSQESILHSIVVESLRTGAGITMSVVQNEWIDEYLKSGSSIKPSIRICVSSNLLVKDIKQAVKSIKNATENNLETKRALKSPKISRR